MFTMTVHTQQDQITSNHIHIKGSEKMAKCSIKGCKTGATKKLIVKDSQGNTKNRPICEAHANAPADNVLGVHHEGKIIDASSKHH